MCAGGTKVEFGCEMASRGDLAGRRLGVEAWVAVRPADLARREVRLRVGAIFVMRLLCIVVEEELLALSQGDSAAGNFFGCETRPPRSKFRLSQLFCSAVSTTSVGICHQVARQLMHV
jgi:hypothetical protein